MKPDKVKELWVLQWDSGHIMPPMDGESECFMAFPTERDAEKEAETAIEEYGDEGQSLTLLRIHPTRQYGKSVRFTDKAVSP